MSSYVDPGLDDGILDRAQRFASVRPHDPNVVQSQPGVDDSFIEDVVTDGKDALDDRLLLVEFGLELAVAFDARTADLGKLGHQPSVLCSMDRACRTQIAQEAGNPYRCSGYYRGAREPRSVAGDQDRSQPNWCCPGPLSKRRR